MQLTPPASYTGRQILENGHDVDEIRHRPRDAHKLARQTKTRADQRVSDMSGAEAERDVEHVVESVSARVNSQVSVALPVDAVAVQIADHMGSFKLQSRCVQVDGPAIEPRVCDLAVLSPGDAQYCNADPELAYHVLL